MITSELKQQICHRDPSLPPSSPTWQSLARGFLLMLLHPRSFCSFLTVVNFSWEKLGRCKNKSKKQKLKESSINYVNLLEILHKRHKYQTDIKKKTIFKGIKFLEYWYLIVKAAYLVGLFWLGRVIEVLKQNKFQKFNGFWWEQLNSLLNNSNKSIFGNSILLYWFPE